jgi:hypothetical protein
MDADLNKDGLIDPDEWRAFVTQNPTVIKYMTILQLKYVQGYIYGIYIYAFYSCFDVQTIV